jgi:hypothetical protein
MRAAPAGTAPPIEEDLLKKEYGMQKPEKVPPEERPHGWQYPAGVVIILLMAAVAWLLLR